MRVQPLTASVRPNCCSLWLRTCSLLPHPFFRFQSIMFALQHRRRSVCYCGHTTGFCCLSCLAWLSFFPTPVTDVIVSRYTLYWLHLYNIKAHQHNIAESLLAGFFTVVNSVLWMKCNCKCCDTSLRDLMTSLCGAQLRIFPNMHAHSTMYCIVQTVSHLINDCSALN